MADKQMSVHVTISAADQASPKIKAAVESLNGLEGALRKAQTSSEQFRSKWDATFTAASAVGGKVQIAGAAILGIGGIAVKTASDFGEMSSMAGEVFKGQTEAATAWADATGEALNRSRADLLQYAAGFQGLFTPMGIARGEAAQMSEAVATLAVDLGSFWNKQEPDVVRDLASAFAGETEAMRKYGVFLSDAALDQELFNRGVKGGTQAATEAEKAHARMAVIMRATKDAQGDAARTSGSLENQIKGIQAEMKEAAIAAGQALVPALEELAPIAKEALEDLTAFLQTPAGEAFVKWAAGLALFGVTGGTAVKHLGDLAFATVQVGSLGKSVWDRFGGGAAKAADATEEVSEAIEAVASKGRLVSGLALFGGAAAGIGIAEWARSWYAEQMDAGRAIVNGLAAGIEGSDAVMEAMREQMSGAIAEARKSAAGMQATGEQLGEQLVDGMQRSWWQRFQQWAADAASGIEAATGMDRIPGYGTGGSQRMERQRAETLGALLRKEAELRKAVAEATQKTNELSRDRTSVDYHKAMNDELEKRRDLLVVQANAAQWSGDEEAVRAYALSIIQVDELIEKNRTALQALDEELDKSTALTKAQTKANEDAVKAADGYSDAYRSAQKATADVADAIESASEKVSEAMEDQASAWRDAAERVQDAEQAKRDAIEDGAERVQDAQERVTEARKRAADAEIDAAEQIEDLEDSLADARKRAADAAEDVLETERDIADDRVKIERDAAEKIEDTRKSTADKLKSLSERMAELQAKLRGDDKGNMFMVGGRMVMVSDKEADAIRERLKLMEDIRKVQADITKAKADEAAKVADIRKAEGERLDDWRERSGERREQAAERASDASRSLSKAERRIPRQIAQAEERVADAYKSVADAEEALADAREEAARRIADSEEALAKAKEAAARAINDAETKRLEAEAARAKTFASISEKLEQVAEKLGIAWMKLDETGRASTLGIPGAMATVAGQHQRAMDIGRQIAGGLTAPDVAQSMTAFSGLNVGAPGVATGGGRYGVSAGSVAGAAHVVIGLEPGLVARQLQQDPARGVVVQIARATTAKAPAAGKW